MDYPGKAIVHFTDCYAPRTGGIESQVQNLVRAQRAAGLNVLVVTATVGPREEGVVRITARVPFDLPIHPRTKFEISHFLNSQFSQPQNSVTAHVHLGVTSPFAWGVLRALNEINIPTVITVHSIWGLLAQPGYSLFSERLNSANFLWTSVSEQAANRVSRSLGVDLAILPNGIDVGAWNAASTRSSETDAGKGGNLRIVSVLRLAPRKRIGPLLRILNEIKNQNSDVSTIIVGDGPLRKRSERYARKHSLPIEFTGRLAGEEIRQIFAGSDIFLQPSIQESFGIAALEARAAGLIVLARAETGTSSFITSGETGFLEESDDTMVTRVLALADNRELVTKMKAFNRQNPPPFAWPDIVALSNEYYKIVRSNAQRH